MKIALLTKHIYPYAIGGMQRHSFYLAKYLARNGIYVDLYHCGGVNKERHMKDLLSTEEQNFINEYEFEYPQSIYFPGHYLKDSYELSKSIFSILKDKVDVDFIYVQGFAGWELMRQKRNGFDAPPVGINFHGLNMYQKLPSLKGGAQLLMLRPFVSKLLREADYVFHFGGKQIEILESLGIKRRQMFLSPNAIDSDWLVSEPSKQSDTLRFLYIGRYERLKGIEELYKIIDEIGSAFSCEFHFVGPIPEKKKKSGENIKYWGVLHDKYDVRKVIRSCDVLLCPSFSEGMPTVILEAMASGLAIIATDVGAVSHMVDQENGWLIEPGNLYQMKNAIESACKADDKELFDKKSISIKKVRYNFTWDKAIITTIRSIEEILQLEHDDISKTNSYIQ